jgi:hypothetical protein
VPRKPKSDPPEPDDPRFARTCNLCGTTRQWVVAICKCGGVEFSIPDSRKTDTIDTTVSE